MPKRAKRGELCLYKRGAIWWVSYYDTDGKKKGDSLKTKSEAEAKEKVRDMRDRLALAKATKHMSAAQMEDELYFKKHGTYVADEMTQERIRELLDTPEGQLVVAELENQILFKHKLTTQRAKVLAKTDNPTVQDFFPIYMQRYKGILRPKTLDNHRYAWEKLLSLTKPKRLSDIDTKLMRRFLSKCADDGMKPQSAIGYARAIQGVITKAIECDLYNGPKLELPKDIMKLRNATHDYYLTVEQRDRLLSTAKEIDEGIHQWLALMYLAGLRPSECLNLRWEEIAFDQKVIHLQAHPEVNYDLKSHDARTIPLYDVLAEILKLHAQSSGYVLQEYTDEQRANYHSPPASYYQIREAARLPQKCTPKTGRHTFASLLVIDGVSIYKVQHWLGHKDPKTTMRYAHLKAHDEDINRL